MGAKDRAKIRIKRALRHATPVHVVRTRITKQIISNFAEKIGLVYFGYMNHKSDDARLVRGHTVSRTHLDNHYCVGTVNGYDVTLVLRNDVVRTRSGKLERCHWLIYAIDLRTKQSVPRFYIGHQSRDAVFAASYEQLYPVALGYGATYPAKFMSDYTVYSSATHAMQIELLLSPHTAEVMVNEFRNASVEVQDNTLYLYVESERPSEATLEKLLSNGLWLAQTIDESLKQ